MKAASSDDYAVSDGDGRDATSRACASGGVSTDANVRDENGEPKSQPALTTDPFVAAGAFVAERLTRELAEPMQIEMVLQRVVEQRVALSRDGELGGAAQRAACVR